MNMQVLDCSWLWGREKNCDMKLVLKTHTNPAAAAEIHTPASYSDTLSRAPRSSLGTSPPRRVYCSSTTRPATAAFYFHDKAVSASTSPEQRPLAFHYHRPLTLAELDFEDRLDADADIAENDCSRTECASSPRPWPNVRMEEVPDEPMPQLILLEQEHHLHAVIVASASAHFKQLITTAIGTEETNRRAQPLLSGSWAGYSAGQASFKYSFVELVDPDQFLAAAVLAFIYMHKLPQSSERTVKHLLNMIQVSHRWVIPSCVQACHEALASIHPQAWLPEDANAIYSLPASILTAQSLEPALNVAKERLLWIFSDVDDIVDCPLYLTQQWLRLPYAAVLALLTSDGFWADSEDTAITLLSWWLEDDVGKKCTGVAELAELRAGIRYSRLSAAYLTQIVPQLPMLCISEKQTIELLEVQSWEAKSGALLPAHLVQRLSVPAGWLAPARMPSEYSSRFVLNVDISEADLRAKFQNAAARKSRGPMVSDYTTSAIVRGIRVTLRLGFGQPNEIICAVEMHAQLPRWDTLMDIWPGVPCEIRVSLIDPGLELDQQFQAQKRGLVLGQAAWFVNELAPDHHGSPLHLSWWAPFLTEGRARLTATISLEPPACYHYA